MTENRVSEKQNENFEIKFYKFLRKQCIDEIVTISLILQCDEIAAGEETKKTIMYIQNIVKLE